MSDCRIYELPNQKKKHIEFAESKFEEMGADLDDSEVVFVGGTLYAHDYKARHPEANVTAVEVEPIAAYTQRFAGSQLEEGTEAEQIADYLFNFGLEKQEGVQYETVISQDEYEEIREVHEDFVEDEDLFDKSFLEEILFMEPEYGANEIAYSQIRGHKARSDIEEMKQHFFNHKRNIVEKWLRQFEDMVSGYKYDVDKTISKAQEQFHDNRVIDTEELREVAPDPREDTRTPVDSVISMMQHCKMKSHRRHAEEEGSYFHATETKDGRIKISKSSRSTVETHEGLLENIEQVERPDEIVVEDIRDMCMDADIIFSNNVFRYFNSQEEVRDTVDDIADEEGAVLESSIGGLGKVVPDRVSHVPNPYFEILATGVNL